MELERLKYPVGKFKSPEIITEELRVEYIKNIEDLPDIVEKIVAPLSAQQLNTPYRPEGWTVRQVVHHMADSHINSYVRFRWTLTEDEPMIKPYNEKPWAELPDAKDGDVELSLSLLKSLHARWVVLLRAMSQNDYQKKLGHPDWTSKLSLNKMVALYSWHCLHHTAHITELIRREGW